MCNLLLKYTAFFLGCSNWTLTWKHDSHGILVNLIILYINLWLVSCSLDFERPCVFTVYIIVIFLFDCFILLCDLLIFSNLVKVKTLILFKIDQLSSLFQNFKVLCVISCFGNDKHFFWSVFDGKGDFPHLATKNDRSLNSTKSC